MDKQIDRTSVEKPKPPAHLPDGEVDKNKAAARDFISAGGQQNKDTRDDLRKKH
jgi:hypothetical protein